MIPLSNPLRLICCGLFLCLWPGNLPADEEASTNTAWFTRVWQSDDGLPNDQVSSIVQAPDGYLWVATAAGLARFDGTHFTPFPYRKINEGQDERIRAITPMHDGSLLVVPVRGRIVLINPDLSRAEKLTNGLPESTPIDVAEDGDGALWLAYGKGMLYRMMDGQVKQFTARDRMPTNYSIYSLAMDGSGNVWMSKGGQVGFFNDEKFHLAVRLYQKPRLCADHTNGVWIAAGSQLCRCDAQGNVQKLGALPSDSPSVTASVILEDHTGAVWIGTDNAGLFRYHDGNFQKIETSHPAIVCLAEDREGNIWAGTGGGGLDRIAPRAVRLEGLGTGPSMMAVRSVCEDTNGLLWGASQDGQLVIRTNEQWQAVLTDQPWHGAVSCVAADNQGRLWIGTRNRRLFCWHDNDYQEWNQDSTLASYDILSLLPAKNGDLWIGESGLSVVQCLSRGQIRRLAFDGFFGKISSLAEDTAGNIWVGTLSGQLLRADGNRLVDATLKVSGPAYPSIRCLYGTPDGALWVGYGGWGLGRYQDGHFARLSTEQGLPDGTISQIVSDGDGWLWFGSDRGIFKVRQNDLEAAMAGKVARVEAVSYGRNEGLSSMQADYDYQTVSTRSRDGRLWISMRKALAVVDPKVLPDNLQPLPILLTRMTIDGRVIASDGNIDLPPEVANLKALKSPLQLPPDHRKVEVEFAAPDFSTPENVHFRYQLSGFDDGWVDAETRGSAVYPRLPAGDYRFRVEAANGNGFWNDIRSPLAFTVTPFVWQTWWFQLGTLALFTLLVAAIVRYVSFRRLHQKMQALAQQAALDKERTRIARDLHDDLGGSLTQVKQLFELALRNHATPAKMNLYLQRGLVKTQHGIKSLDETVWAVNPHNDSLPHLIDYIGQSAVEFLHAADIRCRADLPANPPGHIISAEARHNLFLAVKEALSNVVRHAHASEVQFQAAVTNESLTLVVQDNGDGFDQAPVDARADGLRNMRQRMEEIGGRFDVRSGPGAGTTISLTYYWAARNFK